MPAKQPRERVHEAPTAEAKYKRILKFPVLEDALDQSSGECIARPGFLHRFDGECRCVNDTLASHCK